MERSCPLRFIMCPFMVAFLRTCTNLSCSVLPASCPPSHPPAHALTCWPPDRPSTRSGPRRPGLYQPRHLALDPLPPVSLSPLVSRPPHFLSFLAGQPESLAAVPWREPGCRVLLLLPFSPHGTEPDNALATTRGCLLAAWPELRCVRRPFRTSASRAGCPRGQALCLRSPRFIMQHTLRVAV